MARAFIEIPICLMVVKLKNSLGQQHSLACAQSELRKALDSLYNLARKDKWPCLRKYFHILTINTRVVKFHDRMYFLQSSKYEIMDGKIPHKS